MLLSIVTINKNNLSGLTKTIESLKAQKSRKFQWLLIDGGSTDGSVEAAKKFINSTDILISEADSGIYCAMNKGCAFASGEYILFLNSGDILIDGDCVSDINANLERRFDLILYGFLVRGFSRLPKPLWWRYWSLPTSHQAILYRKRVLLENPFYEIYRFAADFEHFLRINRDDLRILSVNRILVENEVYGSDQHLDLVLTEYRKALLDNGFPRLWAEFVYFFKRVYLRIVLK